MVDVKRLASLHCGMQDEKHRPRYRIVGENWTEGWFLLSLLAGLFLGVPGLVGAVASYLTIRAVGSKLPNPLLLVAALAAAVLSFLVAQVALGRR